MFHYLKIVFKLLSFSLSPSFSPPTMLPSPENLANLLGILPEISGLCSYKQLHIFYFIIVSHKYTHCPSPSFFT